MVPSLYILTMMVFVLHTFNCRPMIRPSLGIRLDHLNTSSYNMKNTLGMRTTKPPEGKTILVLLLILGGDVESNPGPIKFPCKMCQKPVANNHRAVVCDNHNCQQWVHIKCGNITPSEYEEMKGAGPSKGAVWFCPACENLNLLTSTDSEPISTDNSFSSLSAISDDEVWDTSPRPSPHDRSDTSSTDSETRNRRRKPIFRKLKLLLVNCRSLKSKRKQRDLQALVQQEDPDIICGTETHLDNTYFTSEVFPDTYDIHRKDRNRYGGGVFIGVRRDLLAMPEETLDTDCEAIWVKIIFAGKQPLYIGSFYRPTNDDPAALLKLDEALKKLTQKNTLPNIVLLGDFNTPHINWENNTITNQPQYGYHLNQVLIDLANDNVLSQMQQIPSRGG